MTDHARESTRAGPVRLKLDWCNYKAARYATARWHYSRSMPAGKTVKIGVWENERFVGCVIFSHGSNRHIGREFGLDMFSCCELTRIALNRHVTPVTRIVAIAIRMLRRQSSGLRVILSYADCDQNHHGGIYAGGNWVYLGKVQLNGGTPRFRIHGRVLHGRSIHSRYGKGSQNLQWLKRHIDPGAEKVLTLGKHKYAYPLDDGIKKRLELLRKPYPKRVGSIDGDAAENQSAEGGSNPTPTLS